MQPSLSPKVAAIQMTSSHIIDDNLDMAAALIAKAAEQGVRLAVLPENFALMGLQANDKIVAQENYGNGKIQQFLADQAQRHNIWLVGGTIPISVNDGKHVYADSLVITDQGVCINHYRKIHLFDINLTKHREAHQESATIKAGDEVVITDSPIGKLGLAVCYDIRFPELFRLLFQSGAQIFSVPAAFTVPTGEAHWEILLRSRAIENFCYVIAAAQTGKHTNGRATYGHSMIIDPWGKILAELPTEIGVITAEIDLRYLSQVREDIPIAAHQRFLVTNDRK